MSAWKGALAASLGLVVEEVLVTNAGGPAAIAGFAGIVTNALDHFADPGVPAIPLLGRAKSAAPAKSSGGSSGSGQSSGGQGNKTAPIHMNNPPNPSTQQGSSGPPTSGLG